MQIKYSIGNLKIGKDTLILNITSATDCQSRALGLCKIKHCYALQAEKQWPQVLPYRRAQALIWDKTSAADIAAQLNAVIIKKKLEYIRINESGDFKDQADVSKLFDIVRRLPVIVYCYTARRDLSFKNRPKNLIITGSSFMIDNNFSPYHKPGRSIRNCAMNCRICNLCKTAGKNKILVPLH